MLLDVLLFECPQATEIALESFLFQMDTLIMATKVRGEKWLATFGTELLFLLRCVSQRISWLSRFDRFWIASWRCGCVKFGGVLTPRAVYRQIWILWFHLELIRQRWIAIVVHRVRLERHVVRRKVIFGHFKFNLHRLWNVNEILLLLLLIILLVVLVCWCAFIARDNDIVRDLIIVSTEDLIENVLTADELLAKLTKVLDAIEAFDADDRRVDGLQSELKWDGDFGLFTFHLDVRENCISRLTIRCWVVDWTNLCRGDKSSIRATSMRYFISKLLYRSLCYLPRFVWYFWILRIFALLCWSAPRTRRRAWDKTDNCGWDCSCRRSFSCFGFKMDFCVFFRFNSLLFFLHWGTEPRVMRRRRCNWSEHKVVLFTLWFWYLICLIHRYQHEKCVDEDFSSIVV